MDGLGAAAAAAAGGQPLPELLDTLLHTLTGDGGSDDTVLMGMRWTR
ncbi:hypothetical protein [Geodermatophilus sp. SYSU D01036]